MQWSAWVELGLCKNPMDVNEALPRCKNPPCLIASFRPEFTSKWLQKNVLLWCGELQSWFKGTQNPITSWSGNAAYYDCATLPLIRTSFQLLDSGLKFSIVRICFRYIFFALLKISAKIILPFPLARLMIKDYFVPIKANGVNCLQTGLMLWSIASRWLLLL